MSRLPLHHRIARAFYELGERLGDAWYAFVGPIERAAGRIGESLLSATDSFTGLETLVVRCVRFVFWPVTTLLGLVGSLLPSGPTGGGFLRGLFGRAGKAVAELAERLNLDWAVRGLVWVTWPLWRPLASLLGFLNAWLATRRARELALAAPAILLTLPFVWAAFQGTRQSQGATAQRYKVAVRDAIEQGDYARADLYERKLAQLGVDTRRRDYMTALALEEQGLRSEAYERMARLAPAESAGYGPAHAWFVQGLATSRLGVEYAEELADNARRLSLLERHLDHLAELEWSPAQLALPRALVYAQSNRLGEAIDLLEPYSDQPSQAASMRLKLLAQQGDKAAAREQARVVLEGTRQSSRPDYAAWVLAGELLGDPDEVESALEAWIAADPSDAPRQALARQRQERVVRMIRRGSATPEAVVSALLRACENGADLSWLNTFAAELLLVPNQFASRVLEEIAASDAVPPAALSVLGAHAAGHDEILSARLMLARALEARPGEARDWNNYAWTLIQEPSPDPHEALEASLQAIALSPGDYRFRETRGQILLALGRWDEAVDDLEYALNGMPDAPEVHRSLASAYERLERPQLAELHRRQAER